MTKNGLILSHKKYPFNGSGHYVWYRLGLGQFKDINYKDRHHL
jgi:hypothetical protein